jgi:hypothetical protein
MSLPYGRLARTLLLAGGITAAIAAPAITGTPLLANHQTTGSDVALAAPANNGDKTNDNSEERNLEGQILQIRDDVNPPQALVGQVGGNVWANIYNNQLHDSGVNQGDYVHMHGQYGDHGVFDANQVDVTDRFSDNGNGNGNGNGNDNS